MSSERGSQVQPPRADSFPGETGQSQRLASGYQGAVYLVQAPSGPLIVKKAMGRGLVRAVRRAMLRREYAIYQRLAGMAGVPACHGLRDGDELVLDFIEGRSLRDAALPPAERARFFEELLALIQAIHRAGVAHGDLKRKDNVLCGPGGAPHLIDFGIAIAAPPGCGSLRRALFDLVCRMDLNAWFKLKYQGDARPVDPADLQLYRPTLPERLARGVREPWRRLTLRRWRKARS